jgi:hypothetical protein
MNGRAWTFYDRRTGMRASIHAYPSLAEAEIALAGFLEYSRGEDRRLALHLEIVELTPETWGTLPGEVIAKIEGAKK